MHVFGDIDHEGQKLRHVINNISGTLRSMVECLFKLNSRTKERWEDFAVSQRREKGFSLR